MSNRLIGCTTAMSKGRRPNQKVEDFSSYLTPTDVAVLAGEGNLYTKLETLVSRCLAVGMTIPSETSIRQILAAGIAAGINQGESKDQLAMVQEFKRLLKNKAKNSTNYNIHVAIYPSDPKTLPGEIYEAAYGKEKPVESAEVRLPTANSALIPVRRSNKMVRDTPGFAVAGMQNNNMGMNMAMGTMLQMLNQCMAGANGGCMKPSNLLNQLLQLALSDLSPGFLGEVRDVHFQEFSSALDVVEQGIHDLTRL